MSPFIGIDKKFDFVEIRHRCRVASIDDSSVILKYLEHEFQELGFVEHVGSFTESRNASAQALAVKPDLITLDIQMPVKNGIEVLKEITAKQDIPVIMISSVELYQGSLVFEALNSGAFDYIQKPDLHSKA